MLKKSLSLGLLCLLWSSLYSSSDFRYELEGRYAPYADWAEYLDLKELLLRDVDIWWRTPEQFRQITKPETRPLEGLRIALDPGHIGGDWADQEGRHFRVSESDFWVREGELVLEVAQMIRAGLESLGAEVHLLRESSDPVNPKLPTDYWEQALKLVPKPDDPSLEAQLKYLLAVRGMAVRQSIIIGELAERARLVNQQIQPDALISLHINAAPWPKADSFDLVNQGHTHVLIFGCLSATELASARQREQLKRKLANGSGMIEVELGGNLAQSLATATGQAASQYSGKNAFLIDSEQPYLWARNLMLLRTVECPVILLEPYVANSRPDYARIQAALGARSKGTKLPEQDILIEYADAVIRGILETYGK